MLDTHSSGMGAINADLLTRAAKGFAFLKGTDRCLDSDRVRATRLNKCHCQGKRGRNATCPIWRVPGDAKRFVCNSSKP